MLPLERTHLLRDDLAWLPAGLRALRWSVAGAIWTGVVGTVIAAAALGPGVVVALGKGVALLTVGGIYLGDRAARTALRVRLGRLARGQVRLDALAQEPDGELVHVRGRVRAYEALPGFLHGTPAVYRRMIFVLGGTKVVHEAAVDFGLVDEAGELITVAVAGSRLLLPGGGGDADRAEYPDLPRFLELPLPPSLGRVAERARLGIERGAAAPPVSACEFLVRDGEEVEVVGYKTRVVDPTVAMRLERETPMRAALRSGRELPLLITPRFRE
ncbi:MAG TPA: hypothetical protein VH877_12190 [Polyangia bacterium]|jgi:hypothetical protein|nr:hypothetical protein [Polyangia bacterium]